MFSGEKSGLLAPTWAILSQQYIRLTAVGLEIRVKGEERRKMNKTVIRQAEGVDFYKLTDSAQWEEVRTWKSSNTPLV